MPAPTRLPRAQGQHADDHRFRLSSGEECVVKLFLAGEPTDTAWPILVVAEVAESDGSLVQLPGNTHTLPVEMVHPDRIAHGQVSLSQEKERLAAAAAERMERYLPAARQARQMRRLAAPAPVVRPSPQSWRLPRLEEAR